MKKRGTTKNKKKENQTDMGTVKEEDEAKKI